MLLPEKLESRNTHKPPAMSRGSCIACLLRCCRSACVGLSEEKSLSELLLHELLGCLACCLFSHLLLPSSSQPLFGPYDVLQKTGTRGLCAILVAFLIPKQWLFFLEGRDEKHQFCSCITNKVSTAAEGLKHYCFIDSCTVTFLFLCPAQGTEHVQWEDATCEG